MFRDRCPRCGTLAQTVERSSRSFDPNVQGIGSGPRLGARYNTFLEVPQAPTLDRTHRYLFQLAALMVGEGQRVTLTSVWQGLYIGAYPIVVAVDPNDNTPQLVERQVLDPAFKFPDGNTNWSMLWRPGDPFDDAKYDPAPILGAYPGLRATESGLLYLPARPIYTPPNGGDPGGTAIGSLTGFTHLRFALPGNYPAQLYQVDGPGTLAFDVSLWQTDPETRILWTPRNGADLGGYTEEQRFIWDMQQNPAEQGDDRFARYTHVAGGFTAQARFLCCEEPRPGVRLLSLEEIRASLIAIPAASPERAPTSEEP